MENRYVISLVLNAHLPFVREYHSGEDVFLSDPTGRGGDLPAGAKLQPGSAEESWFFEAISETYLPLLEALDRLENDHIPFRLGVCLSPPLCQMLSDELMLKKYLAYTDRQIEFGQKETERTEGDLQRLAKHYYDNAVERRVLFTERYEGNILKVFERYQKKGKIEILATSATHAFLPFLCPYPEAIQAQMETAISTYRQHFGRAPQGFWLPELGWTGELDACLRLYDFSYTIIDSHGFVFGKPAPRQGTFYPVKTPCGMFVLGRDFYAARDLGQMQADGPYRDNNRDVGYEFPPEQVSPFLTTIDGSRRPTGFKYWRAVSGQTRDVLYDPQVARNKAIQHARVFLETRFNRLEDAAKEMDAPPLCLCAYNADSFGRFWHEGPWFIEALFRLGSDYRTIQFKTPAEYIFKQDISAFETSLPDFSSWGYNGYAESWLDASNDWMYRHMIRSIQRMAELAERFPDDSGLKERALNQAAREILLAQSSDWPKLLYNQESTEYARSQIENALRNFTTIYESLGSNYISTEWLTGLERQHNIFPHINYRVFRRKR